MTARTVTQYHGIVEQGTSGPTEAGGLDHGYAVCACGFRTGNSLGERWAVKQLWDHVHYMNRKAAR